jgi:AraC family transcriptional regulator
MPASFAFAFSRYESGATHPAHDHDEMHLSIVLAGGLEERVGGAVVSAGPLSVVCKDPGVRHADRFGPRGAALGRLSVGSALRELIDPGRDSGGWIWRHTPDLARPFLRLVARARNGASGYAADDDDVVAVLAALTSRHAPTHGAPPAWLRTAVDRVRDGAVSSVGELAGQVGVHPVYLTRCIRRWYGFGSGELIRAQRLQRAAAMLIDSSATVSEVAHASGFADEPHLHRSFRRATGHTPREFRSLGWAVMDPRARRSLVSAPRVA